MATQENQSKGQDETKAIGQDQAHQEQDHGKPWHNVTLDDGHISLKVYSDNYYVFKVGGKVLYNGVQPPPPPKP